MRRTADAVPGWLRASREHWRWRGRERPPFADVPGPEQHSVWDYPRPAVLVPDAREIVIRWGTIEVARTRRAVRALETSHPPSFYLPWDDVASRFLRPAEGMSFCEWKGRARYWTLVGEGRFLARVAWSYPEPLPGSESIARCVAFYPGELQCTVDGQTAQAQPGGFYGGWITPDVCGPFKGERGSEAW